MANLKSSKQDAKKSKLRAKANSMYLSALKTAVKKFSAAITAGDKDGASSLLGTAFSRIGRAQKQGVLKKNAAARRMSALSRALAKLG